MNPYLATGASLLSGVLISIALGAGAKVWSGSGVVASFVALVPFLLVAIGAGWRRGFLLGLVMGSVTFFTTSSWALLFGVHAWVALSLGQAAFIAAFGALVGSAPRGVPSVFIVPAGWVLVEWLRNHWPLGGYGFGQLAYSQADSPFRYAAAVGGAILVGGFLVMFNTAVAVSIKTTYESGEWWRLGSWTLPIVAFGIFGSAALAGYVSFPRDAEGRTMNVAVIQPYDVNRPLTPEEDARQLILGRLVAGSRTALSEITSIDLLVWPEAGLRAEDPASDLDTRSAVREALRGSDAWLIANGQPRTPERDGFFNRNYFFAPTGELVETSDKEKLVAFGEYVPMRGILTRWVRALDRVAIDGIPGESRLFHHPKGMIAAVICFESVFSEPIRRGVTDGGELVVVETNNRSFEWSSLSEQHLTASRIRAVEVGRPIVHAAISGISGIVETDGRVVTEAGLFRQAILTREVQLPTGLTLFARTGEWPAVVVSLGTIAFVGVLRWRYGRNLEDD